MSLLNWVIGTGIANPMDLAKETGFNLLILTQVAEGHSSAMSIGSFDSSKCKGTAVLDSGPRHDSITQHRVTDCKIPILGLGGVREVVLARGYWNGGPPRGRYPRMWRCHKSWW